MYVNMLAIITALKATHTIYHGDFEIYSGMNGANYYLNNSSSLTKPELKSYPHKYNYLKYLCI